MVDVKKEVKERIDTARETVKGARNALNDAIVRAEKAGREQFQELVARGEALGEKYEPRITELAGKVEPRLGEIVETQLGTIRGLVRDLNARLAEKSAALAEKPKASKSTKAAARKPAARKAPAKKAATRATKTTKAASKKPETAEA